MRNKVELLSRTPVFSGKIFEVVRDSVRLPNDKVVERAVVRHPGAVIVLPKLGSGILLLIEQYRHAVGTSLLEFPAGTLEPNETPLVCAKREIIEETGYQAASWTELGVFYPAPGFCSELQHGYLATELSLAQAVADEDEIIEVCQMSIDEVENAIRTGQLNDTKSIALFTRAKLIGLLSEE